MDAALAASSLSNSSAASFLTVFGFASFIGIFHSFASSPLEPIELVKPMMSAFPDSVMLTTAARKIADRPSEMSSYTDRVCSGRAGPRAVDTRRNETRCRDLRGRSPGGLPRESPRPLR